MPKKVEFENPKVMKRIFELKSDGLSDSKTAEKIKEEFGISVFRTTIPIVYEKYVKKAEILSSLIPEEKREKFTTWNDKIGKKIESIDKATTTLMDKLEEVGKNLTPEDYIKLAPTILAVCREILNQIIFLKKQQEQMMIEQRKSVYSPLEILEILHKEQEKKKKEEEKLKNG